MKRADLRKLFGVRFRALREERQITQQEVADYVGCGRPFVTRIETGERSPSFDMLPRFAEILRVDEMDLFTFPGATVRHDVGDLSRRASLDVNFQVKAILEQAIGIVRPKERAVARRK